MAFGKSSTSTRDFNLLEDEYAIAAWWKPYIMQASGAAIAFFGVAILRIIMWLSYHFGGNLPPTEWMVGGTIVTGLICWFFLYHLYKRRQEQGGEALLRLHISISTLFVTAWGAVAFLDNPMNWMFGQVSLYLFLFGTIVLMVTWAGRRWAYKSFQKAEPVQEVNPYGEIGLGDTTHSMGAGPIPGAEGKRVRIKPKLGVTLKDFQNATDKLAQMFGVAVSRIRVWGNSEDPNTVYIDVFDDMPFAKPVEWAGPIKPGASISEPVEFATYDMGERPKLYLGGKNGSSSQHYLTAGMSGAGKSKGWQVIYGSVLSRSEVTVLYADPAKALATVKPMISGISWFADGVEESLEMFKGVERAIKSRGTWLTNQGLDHWEPGCGLNLLILHIEEAARFKGDPNVTKEDLARLTMIVQEARSAGIVVVYSLQRLTADRIPTSLRYNLGGILCFGLKQASDTRIVFSGDTAAMPHTLKNKFPGTFYFDAEGIDQDKVGFQLKTDKLDIKILEQAVKEGAKYRTPMDKPTASALGQAYENYRNSENGRKFTDMNSVNSSYESMNEPTAEYEKYEEPVKNTRSQNFTSDPQIELDALYEFIVSLGLETFRKSEIWNPRMKQTGKNNKGTISKQIDKLVDDGRLVNTGGDIFKVA